MHDSHRYCGFEQEQSVVGGGCVGVEARTLAKAATPGSHRRRNTGDLRKPVRAGFLNHSPAIAQSFSRMTFLGGGRACM